MVLKNIKIGGFLTFEMSKKEYTDFLKNTKKDYFIILNNSKKFGCYLEIKDKNIKKIGACLVYVFFPDKKKINFKLANLTFTKKKNKIELLSSKSELLKYILLKIDYIDYDLDSNPSNRPEGVFKFR